jgi:hypothetical protein
VPLVTTIDTDKTTKKPLKGFGNTDVIRASIISLSHRSQLDVVQAFAYRGSGQLVDRVANM